MSGDRSSPNVPRLFANRFGRDPSGTVAPIFGVTAALLIVSVGVTIDYGRTLKIRSEMQSALDNAVIAASAAAVEADSERAAVALQMFAANYSGHGVQPSVTVNGTTVTMTARDTVPTALTGIAGIESIDVSGGATAARRDGLPVCLLALNPTAPDAIHLVGSSQMTAQDCAVYANSAAADALHNQGTAVSTAAEFCAVGGFAGSNFSPLPTRGCRPVKDPYAGLPEPATAGCTYNNRRIVGGTVTASPGIYCGGLEVRNATVTFAPGVYVIKDGQLRINANSTAAGSGITFYFYGNGPQGATVDINSQTVVDWSAPTSGPYAGLVFVQHQEASPGFENNLNGGANTRIVGAGYFPTQVLRVGGSGNFGVNSPMMPFVADKIYLHGSAQMTLKVDAAAAGMPDTVPRAYGGVRLSE
jgi:Flp pilus assembly protein TadG